MEFLKITALGLFAGILYGVLHDQVTARVCIEYFTVGHPRLIDSDSPTVLALFWGVVATWWVGLPLGFLLACAARLGGRPRLTALQLLRPLRTLLAAMATMALIGGLAGLLLALHGDAALPTGLASAVPKESHARFIADLWAHTFSYLSGIVGGLVLVVLSFRRRNPKRQSALQHLPEGGRE